MNGLLVPHSAPAHANRALLFCMASLLALLLVAPSASASKGVDLFWVAINGEEIERTPDIMVQLGDEITLEVNLATGTTGMQSFAFDLIFDEDGKNELSFLTPLPEPTGDGQYSYEGSWGPVDSTLGTPGSIGGYVGCAVDSDCGTQTYGTPMEWPLIDTITFVVTSAPSQDGDDIRPIFSDAGEWRKHNGDLIPEKKLYFHGASVKAVPEPGTALLLSLGLLGLAAPRGRNR